MSPPFRKLLPAVLVAGLAVWVSSCSSARIAARPEVIHQAAGVGDTAGIASAISAGASVDLPDGHGSTPLRYAVRSNQVEAVGFLLERGADPNHVPDDGETLLLDACNQANGTIASMLLKAGANIEAFGESGMTPLLIATAKEDKPLFSLLLERNASPSGAPPDCMDPLSVATCKGDPFFFDQLLAAGAGLKRVLPGGNTHLHIASSFGNEHAVRVLLTKEVDSAATNREGSTALDLAIFDYHYGCAAALLQGKSPEDVRKQYANARPFYQGLCLKMTAETRDGDEARQLLAEARGYLASALDESRQAIVRWEEMQREEARKEKIRKRQEFVIQLLAAAIQGGIQGGIQGAADRYSYKQYAQMTALRNSSTPDQYFSSYSRMMHAYRQPTIASTYQPSGAMKASEGYAPPDVGEKQMLERRVQECESLLVAIDGKLAAKP